MKTKEIEVWMHEKFINGDEWFPVYPLRTDMDGFIKAKLVIEVPEKKIEITESQLRECFDTFRRLDDDQERRLVYSFYEFSRQKLFGNG